MSAVPARLPHGAQRAEAAHRTADRLELVGQESHEDWSGHREERQREEKENNEASSEATGSRNSRQAMATGRTRTTVSARYRAEPSIAAKRRLRWTAESDQRPPM